MELYRHQVGNLLQQLKAAHELFRDKSSDELFRLEVRRLLQVTDQLVEECPADASSSDLRLLADVLGRASVLRSRIAGWGP